MVVFVEEAVHGRVMHETMPVIFPHGLPRDGLRESPEESDDDGARARVRARVRVELRAPAEGNLCHRTGEHGGHEQVDGGEQSVPGMSRPPPPPSPSSRAVFLFDIVTCVTTTNTTHATASERRRRRREQVDGWKAPLVRPARDVLLQLL